MPPGRFAASGCRAWSRAVGFLWPSPLARGRSLTEALADLGPAFFNHVACLRLAFLPTTLAGIPRDEDVRLTGRRSVPGPAGFTAPDPASCGADVDSITLGAPRTAGGIGQLSGRG